MASRPLIAPSILSADFSQLADQIAEAESHGADWFHVDVMDGHFVPNISLGPPIVEACRRSTELPLDVHLMIEAPERYLKAFADAGADHISVHVEAVAQLDETLQSIRGMGKIAGVAINPATPAADLESVLEVVDLALVMSVNPGFGGQAFISEVLPKVSQIREALDERNSAALIEIDGGIDEHTLPAARDAGVDVFVAGSAVFGHPNGIGAGIRALKKALPVIEES